MPIENETKYVLDDRHGELERSLTVACSRILRIRQGYLGPGVRIRETGKAGRSRSTPAHSFTYKQTVDGDVVEVETPISRSDFRKLWTKASPRLLKMRFVFRDQGLTWEVDFFKEDEATYFCLAEVELKARDRRVPDVPEQLRPYLLHTVQRGDRRFSSRNLADKIAASELLSSLRPGLPLPHSMKPDN